MLLHVWVASWEFECCQDDAIVGDRWGGSLILDPAKPSWGKYAKSQLPDDILNLGVTEFEGDVARPPGTADCPAVATVGSARIGVLGTITSGPQPCRGRLRYEGHGGGPYDDVLEKLDCEGVVRRVRGISYVYERRKDHHVPVMQDAPVDLNSTADNYPTDDPATRSPST